ncbi:MAG: NlpC/P60 family protein, partial [Pseudomonadota bacterium]
MDGDKQLDPRLNPYRADLAAEHLRGQVDAPRFAAPRVLQVSAPVLDLCSTPKRTTGLASQLIAGERFAVYEISDDTGLAWGQCETDGYVGYVSAAGLDELGPEPNMKTRPLEGLPKEAAVSVLAEENCFAQIPGQAWVPAQHLARRNAPGGDPVDHALSYLGTPYLWGGRSAYGLDCSALVQLSHWPAGVSLWRDSDQQAGQGKELDRAELSRGDLVFWSGHVGMMV